MLMSSMTASDVPVRLAVPKSHHAKLWLAWRNEPSARRYMPIEPWSESALKRRLGASVPDLSDPEKQEHRWIVQCGKESVGVVSVLRPSFLQGFAEISYHLAEAHQGRGIATAAVTQLVDLIFDQTELERLMAVISVGNRASRRLVEKLGFQHEGTMRRHFVIGGRRVDQCLYGLLRRDWKRRLRLSR